MRNTWFKFADVGDKNPKESKGSKGLDTSKSKITSIIFTIVIVAAIIALIGLSAFGIIGWMIMVFIAIGLIAIRILFVKTQWIQLSTNSIIFTTIMIAVILGAFLLYTYNLINAIGATIITTTIVVLRTIWSVYDNWMESGQKKFGLILYNVIILNLIVFNICNIFYGMEFYYMIKLANSFIEEVLWSIRVAVIPLLIIPIAHIFDYRKELKRELDAINKAEIKYVFSLFTLIMIDVAIVFILTYIPQQLMQFDLVMYNGALASMVYEGQGVNYFSYVFYILLQSPAPALMIAFMVFGAISVMVAQSVGGAGRTIGGFASSIIVIIPMLFIFSIFSGGIKAPDLLRRLLGDGVAQLVFGLAETSAFIMMLAIIGVFITAGKWIGGMTTFKADQDMPNITEIN